MSTDSSWFKNKPLSLSRLEEQSEIHETSSNGDNHSHSVISQSNKSTTSTNTIVGSNESNVEQTPSTRSNSSLAKDIATLAKDIVTVEKTKESSVSFQPTTTTRHIYQEIDPSRSAIIIIICYFVAGLVDSAAFSLWNTFVNIQTGNTIILALNITGQPSRYHALGWIKSMTSVVAYCLGALIFNLIHRAPRRCFNGRTKPPLSRWTFILSFAIQVVALAIVAVLMHAGEISTNQYIPGMFSTGTETHPGDNYRDLVAMALLSFEAAGQVSLSRVLMMNDLPTLVISTLYHDLVADSLNTGRCWAESKGSREFLESQKRQIRRGVGIIALFCGALISGFVSKSRADYAAVMWIGVILKMGVCVAWYFWPAVEPTNKEEKIVVGNGKS